MLKVWTKDREKGPLGILLNVRLQKINPSMYIKLSKEGRTGQRDITYSSQKK